MTFKKPSIHEGYSLFCDSLRATITEIASSPPRGLAAGQAHWQIPRCRRFFKNNSNKSSLNVGYSHISYINQAKVLRPAKPVEASSPA
ncbi:MAG: hypothetical protein ACYC4S_09005 [Rhodoferax sp.]